MTGPNVVYQKAVGEFRHLVGDIVIRPDGLVKFTPDPVGLPKYLATTIGNINALITQGALEDVQARPGVWLAASVDGVPIRWTMTYRNLVWGPDSTPIPLPPPVVLEPTFSGELDVTAGTPVEGP